MKVENYLGLMIYLSCNIITYRKARFGIGAQIVLISAKFLKPFTDLLVNFFFN